MNCKKFCPISSNQNSMDASIDTIINTAAALLSHESNPAFYNTVINNCETLIRQHPCNFLENAQLHNIMGNIYHHQNLPIQSATEFMLSGHDYLLSNKYEAQAYEAFQCAFNENQKLVIDKAASTFGEGEAFIQEGDPVSALNAYNQAAAMCKSARLDKLYENCLVKVEYLNNVLGDVTHNCQE